MQVGPIREVSILRDQVTGVSRGCAFVIYDDKAVAEAAITRIDRHFTLPGASQPIEVRSHGPITCHHVMNPCVHDHDCCLNSYHHVSFICDGVSSNTYHVYVSM